MKRKNRRLRGQDKSTGAEARLSGCLHIQELSPAVGVVAPQRVKCLVLLTENVCIAARMLLIAESAAE